ncbi:MAG: hypothetical protein PHR16_13740 [Methylovulum sp.]|nr:hypothetical protein [Methylovulum sp.]
MGAVLRGTVREDYSAHARLGIISATTMPAAVLTVRAKTVSQASATANNGFA